MATFWQRVGAQLNPFDRGGTYSNYLGGTPTKLYQTPYDKQLGAVGSLGPDTPGGQERANTHSGQALLEQTSFGAPQIQADSLATPTVDPYAQWGGQDAYNNLVSGFGTQKQGIYDTSGQSAENYGLGFKNSILDFLDSLRQQQLGINNKGVQAELAKQQGTQGILGMVGRGIRSGNVLLANKNASDSSASGALAQAYGDIGNRQLAGIGNQYGLAQNDIQQLQGQLQTSTQSGVRKLNTDEQQSVNNIVLDARNQLAQLQAAMTNASLPDQLDLQAEQEKVRQIALAKLQGLDQQLSQGVAGIQPTDIAARRAEAARLAGLGTPVETPFNFSTEAPTQFQGSDVAPGNLPLFTLPKKKTA